HPSVPSSVACQCCPAVPPVSAAQQCHLSVPSSVAHQCCPSVPPINDAQQCRRSVPSCPSLLHISASSGPPHQCPPVPPHQCYLSVLPHQCPSVLPISAASPTH
ncbi:unnamed protein product, partial [Staurois parvus]